MSLNGLYALAWAVVFIGGVLCYIRAVELDEADYADYHLLHGPSDGCWECEDK
jgi:hypothetical protein